MSLDLLVLNFDPDLYNFDYFQQDNVCRFCWKRESCSQLIEITTVENGRTVKNDLMCKISQCLDIDIKRCDRPKKICSECSGQIEKFHNFKQFCQETDKRLREILANHELIVENVNDMVKNVKIENEDVDSKDGNFDELLDCLKHSDGESEHPKLKRSKLKYKPKRTSTYCNICRLDFENADKFNSHNSKCHGIEKGVGFKCFGCDRLFSNRKSRLGHEKNFCKNLLDGYKCNVCDRYLPRRRMYEDHMRDHRRNVEVELPEKMFKCTKCNVSYKTKQMLKEHMFEHNKGKKYVCESCGRVFTRRDYLLKHKLTHTGDKHHVCPHCSYRSTQRSSLIVHIRKHTGERPYQCSICPQQCVTSSNLRAHQRRHQGIKMHECKICNKKFGYKISLQEHMSTHAPAQTHACDQCAASYSRLRALKRHITAKHTEKSENNSRVNVAKEIHRQLIHET